ncbi:MAG: tetraacyldisaccharide 4'-kinase [Pseudomonadota bacterium]
MSRPSAFSASRAGHCPRQAARAAGAPTSTARSARASPRATGSRSGPAGISLPLEGAPVVAFAGIGRPEKFFETLREMGAELRLNEAFPDHHVYPDAVLDRLLRRARAEGALVVTTEKDAVRLPPRFRAEVMALPVRLTPVDAAPLDRVLKRLFSAA